MLLCGLLFCASAGAASKTILVWGDSDKLISPIYAEAFKKGIKGAELVAIPEAGHMVTIEKGDQVLAALGRLG